MIIHQNDSVFENYVPKLKSFGGRKKWVAAHKSTGKKYEGPEPYIIIAIDGRSRDKDLKGFSSTYISAALMEKFYGEEKSTDSTIITDAAKLYNDLNYYKKVQKLQKDIDKMQENEEDVSKQQQQIEAYKKNIQSEAFKSLLNNLLGVE